MWLTGESRSRSTVSTYPAKYRILCLPSQRTSRYDRFRLPREFEYDRVARYDQAREVVRFLRRINPLAEAGEPHHGWLPCSDCLQYRPSNTGYWEGKIDPEEDAIRATTGFQQEVREPYSQ